MSRTGGRTSLAVHSSQPTSRRAPSSTGSNAVPALSRATSTDSSAASTVDTDLASFLESAALLEDDGDGNLVVPNTRLPNCDYTCIFHVLDCSEKFDSFEQWKTHILNHFCGKPLPSRARCCLCDSTFASERQGVAWNQMLDHVAVRHFQHGHTLATSRPDFELFRYMWRNRIITHAQLKTLQMMPAPTRVDFVPPRAPSPPSVGFSNEPYTLQANPGREDRERRTRAQTRPRWS